MRALEQLTSLKGQFSVEATRTAENLLDLLAKKRLHEPADLIQLHETTLFLRAYPQSPRVRELTDEVLFSFQDRIPKSGHEAFEDPEISGICGASITTNFS